MVQKCENCQKEHDGLYGSGRFCCQKCARSFSSKFANTKEKRKRKSITLSGRKSKFKNSGKIYKRKKFKCLNCLKIFEVLTKTERKFCSHLCHTDSLRSNQTGYKYYKQQCAFKFNVYDYPDYFNLMLIDKYGWYKAKNRGNNLNGVSRDHRFSVKRGFELGILPIYLSHPANCQLLRHNDNSSKNTKCSLSIEELFDRIYKWTYGREDHTADCKPADEVAESSKSSKLTYAGSNPVG